MSTLYYNYLNSSVFPQSDSQGWITTTTSPQTFEMVDKTGVISRRYNVIAMDIEVNESSPSDVKIRLNDENSDIYIVKGETYSTEDFPTHQIVCTSPVGSKFRFEAWAVNRSNVY